MQISALPPWVLDEKNSTIAQYVIKVDRLLSGATESGAKVLCGVIERTLYSTSNSLIFSNQRSQFKISASLRDLGILDTENQVITGRYLISVDSYNSSLDLFHVTAIDNYDQH